VRAAFSGNQERAERFPSIAPFRLGAARRTVPWKPEQRYGCPPRELAAGKRVNALERSAGTFRTRDRLQRQRFGGSQLADPAIHPSGLSDLRGRELIRPGVTGMERGPRPQSQVRLPLVERMSLDVCMELLKNGQRNFGMTTVEAQGRDLQLPPKPGASIGGAHLR